MELRRRSGNPWSWQDYLQILEGMDSPRAEASEGIIYQTM